MTRSTNQVRTLVYVQCSSAEGYYQCPKNGGKGGKSPCACAVSLNSNNKSGTRGIYRVPAVCGIGKRLSTTTLAISSNGFFERRTMASKKRLIRGLSGSKSSDTITVNILLSITIIIHGNDPSCKAGESCKPVGFRLSIVASPPIYI